MNNKIYRTKEETNRCQRGSCRKTQKEKNIEKKTVKGRKIETKIKRRGKCRKESLEEGNVKMIRYIGQLISDEAQYFS